MRFLIILASILPVIGIASAPSSEWLAAQVKHQLLKGISPSDRSLLSLNVDVVDRGSLVGESIQFRVTGERDVFELECDVREERELSGVRLSGCRWDSHEERPHSLKRLRLGLFGYLAEGVTEPGELINPEGGEAFFRFESKPRTQSQGVTSPRPRTSAVRVSR